LPLLNNAGGSKVTKYGGYGFWGDLKSLVGKTTGFGSHVKALVHNLNYIDSRVPSIGVLQQRIRDHEVAAFANDPSGERGKKANVK
jgi:hypothetical protein